MLRLRQTTLLLALYLSVVLPLGAQAALTPALQPAAPAANTNAATDPLGRNTPSNAILGYLKAAQEGDYSIAAQYLQMSAARRQVEGEQTASKL
jgi:hypothetical protein